MRTARAEVSVTGVFEGLPKAFSKDLGTLLVYLVGKPKSALEMFNSSQEELQKRK